MAERDLFTFSEEGMRKLVDAYRANQREMSNLKRTLASFGTRRHQTVYLPPSADIIHFELTGTLTLRVPESAIAEEAALAKKLDWDEATGEWVDSGTVIYVVDWFGDEGMWNGLAGYRGWAKKHPENWIDGDGVSWPAYEIIWMERIAQKIRFSSTEYMGETNAFQMSATVDWYNHQGKSPGGTVIIHDPHDLFPDAFDGANGVAYYNNYHERYEVVECQRLAMHASATLTGDGCSGGSLTAGTFTIQPVGEFIGTPVSPQATNPYKHAGATGAQIQLMRISNNMPGGDWVVIDITRTALTVVAKNGVTWSSPDLQQQRIEILAEFCDGTPTPETIVTFADCEA